MSRSSSILFRTTKMHLFPVVVLRMPQAIVWLCQMVEYQKLFSISMKFILGMLLLCFAFPSFEVPGNMFWGGVCILELLLFFCFRAIKEQISPLRHHQVQEEVVK